VALHSLAEKVLDAGLVQPNQTTCGSCTLVVAHAINDPAYAGYLVNGTDPPADAEPAATMRDRFRAQALATHKITSGFKDGEGGFQVPWPQALGTQPWALARQMTNDAGRQGKRYTAQPILPSHRSRTFGRVVSLSGDGHTVPLFVGNRWSPRHVVLALPADDVSSSEVPIYDPANGRCYPIESDDFSDGDLDVAGWEVPWAVVLPT